ncbi:hypothetical protein TNCV_4073241 [Trichonephila clavipes]|uniref:Uncharacterized protein n=1 Tax=Trichonephila clavipes TaxID=2585209 RepID=A0A8X6W9E2_TRICX|nr:hypothetical protein TNCV_4073241 [Trichonephila clavipes]
MSPSQYGGYDPRLVIEWIQVRIRIQENAKSSTTVFYLIKHPSRATIYPSKEEANGIPFGDEIKYFRSTLELVTGWSRD